MSSVVKWYEQNIKQKKVIRFMVNSMSDTLERKFTKEEIRNFVDYLDQRKSHNWNMHIKKYGHERAFIEVCKNLVKEFMNTRFTGAGRNDMSKNNETVDMHETLKTFIGTQDKDADPAFTSAINTDGMPIAFTHVLTPDDSTEAGGDSLGSIDEVKNIATIGGMGSLGDIQGLFGKTDETSIQLLFNPEAAYRKNMVIADSRYRLTDTDGTITQSWNFLNASAVNAAGVINTIGNVKNVVKISVSKLRIPYKDSIIINGSNRVTLLIREFSGMAFVGQENRKFHFMFESSVDGNNIDLVPMKFGDSTAGVFEFYTPITQIDTLTFSWGNPLEPIIFDKDRLIFNVVYNNPARFVTTTGEDHNLLTGDLVYISGMTSDDVITDEGIIDQTNSINGHPIVKIDDTTFDIDGLDFTAVTAPTAALSFEIYFGANRLFVPMELTYIK